MFDINGTLGDWGPAQWADASGTTANNGPQVQTNDIIEQSTVSEGQDPWTGFFQGLIGTGVKYAVQRDAAKNGLQQATAANGQPVYTAQPQVASVGGMNMGGLLIIGAAVLGAVLLVAAKKG